MTLRLFMIWQRSVRLLVMTAVLFALAMSARTLRARASAEDHQIALARIARVQARAPAQALIRVLKSPVLGSGRLV